VHRQGSSDGTCEAAAEGLATLDLPERTLLCNDGNYGLGGSHKVAIDVARTRGHEFLLVLHGDDQGSVTDILPLLEAGRHHETDFLMGARFMPGARLVGYSPLRILANRVFNVIFSAVSGRRLHDLGSGLNLFRLSAFDDGFHRRFADDLTFNYYLILAIAARGCRLEFFPVTWREEDQISNARLWRMGLQMLGLLVRRVIARKAFFDGEHRALPRDAYPSTVIGTWSDAEPPARACPARGG